MASEIVDIIVNLVDKFSKNVDGLQSKLQGFADGATKVSGAFAPISAISTAALGTSIKLSADWQASIDGASRSLDLQGKELEEFGKNAEALTKKLNFQKSSTEIAELSASIGKLGVANKDIFQYAEAVTKVAIATDKLDKVNDMAVDLAKIGGNFKLTTKEVELFGAALNRLDDAGSVTSDQLLNFSRRVSAFAPSMGLSEKQVLAWGSTLVGAGMDVESAASFLKNFTNRLAAVNTLSEPAQKAIEKMGYNLSTLQQDFLKKPNETLISFIERMGTLPKAQQFDTIVQVFGQEWAAAFLNAGGNLDVLRKNLTMAAEDATNLKKLSNEADGMSNSFAGMTKSFKNQMVELGKNLGLVLLPAVNDLLKAINPLLQNVIAFTQTHPEMTKWIVAALGITALIAPIAAFVGMVASAIPIIAGIGAAIGTVLALIVSVPGMIAVAVAAVVGAVVGAVVLIVRNWEWIKETATNVWKAVMDKTNEFINWVKNDPIQAAATFAKWFMPIPYYLGVAIYEASKKTLEFINFFGGLGKYVYNSAVNWGKSLITGFINGLQSMYADAQSAMDTFTNWIAQYLPHSDAKKGALSNLTASGQAFAETFMRGVNGSGINSMLGKALQPSGSANYRMSSPASSNTGTLNYQPVYNITARDSEDILKQLKARDRELLELINKSNQRINRSSY